MSQKAGHFTATELSTELTAPVEEVSGSSMAVTALRVRGAHPRGTGGHRDPHMARASRFHGIGRVDIGVLRGREEGRERPGTSGAGRSREVREAERVSQTFRDDTRDGSGDLRADELHALLQQPDLTGREEPKDPELNGHADEQSQEDKEQGPADPTAAVSGSLAEVG